MLAALTVALSGFYIPIGVSKCYPIQHMVNVLCAIFLGPGYGVMAAFCTSLIRNLMGTRSLLAFPGSMVGALLCGILYGKAAAYIPGRGNWNRNPGRDALLPGGSGPHGKRGGAFYVCDALPYEHLLRDHHGCGLCGSAGKEPCDLLYPGSYGGRIKQGKTIWKMCGNPGKLYGIH